jgi:hypothetical protein
LVLRFPNRDEVRLGDSVYRPGSLVRGIDGCQWRVVGSESPQSWFADGRYILLPVTATVVATL